MKNVALFALLTAFAAAPVVASAEDHKVETTTTTEHKEAAPAVKTEVKKETTEHKAAAPAVKGEHKVETKTETKTHESKEAK